MIETALEEVLNVPFTFHRRPRALPCSMRPVWRLHVLVLMLAQCRAGKASLEQLHVLNWAIRSEETRQLFLQFIKGKRAPNQIIVRYDPSLSRAIDFAFAEKLVTRHEEQFSLLPEDEDDEQKSPAYRVVLSGKGKSLVRQIMADEEGFVVEKAFLRAIGRKVTQSHIESLFTWSPMR